MLPRSAGAALPLHLAAHLHSCAASKHAGRQLLPHAVCHWCAGSLLTRVAGASYRGGQSDIVLMKCICYTSLLHPLFFNLNIAQVHIGAIGRVSVRKDPLTTDFTAL